MRKKIMAAVLSIGLIVGIGIVSITSASAESVIGSASAGSASSAQPLASNSTGAIRVINYSSGCHSYCGPVQPGPSTHVPVWFCELVFTSVGARGGVPGALVGGVIGHYVCSWIG